MLLRCSEKFQSYLEKILPWCKPEETCLIYSQYHGYIDKREGNTAFNQKLYDFVEQFRERGCFVKEDLHTSGHASKQDLVRLCEQVNPKVIIPIHKDEKADFASILSDELEQESVNMNTVWMELIFPSIHYNGFTFRVGPERKADLS